MGSSFDLVGVKQIERVLDPFHINKAIREVYGKDINENLVSMRIRCGCKKASEVKRQGISFRMKARGCNWSKSGAEAMVAILSHITELSDHTFRYQEIKAKDQAKSRVSRRKKSKTFEYCGQNASFPILNAGKASVPYFDLFRHIIHPEHLSYLISMEI